MVHFGVLEQPNLLPASSHQESPGWFLYASSSCFLPCTSPHTSIYPHAHTNTHASTQGPEDISASPGLREHTDARQSLIFSSLFENGEGVESKAETTWHLSPLGAAGEEGRPGVRAGWEGVFSNTWCASGNCCYWTANQEIYGCV